MIYSHVFLPIDLLTFSADVQKAPWAMFVVVQVGSRP
jgi:hypothetical protein